MFERAFLATAAFTVVLLALACAGKAADGQTPLPASGESQCRYLKQFPRCVRLVESDDLRRLAYTAVSDFASEFFYFNCVNQHYDEYVHSVRGANAIGEEERIYAGNQLVLPQPECGDQGALTVSAERRALLDQVAAVLLELSNTPESSVARERLAELAPGAAGETLLLTLDDAPLGRLTSVEYAFAAPVSPDRQDRLLAVLVLTWTEACLQVEERFLLELGVTGAAERLVLGSVGLHRNQPVEVRLTTPGCV